LYKHHHREIKEADSDDYPCPTVLQEKNKRTPKQNKTKFSAPEVPFNHLVYNVSQNVEKCNKTANQEYSP
jgi:hypothetical protein